MKTGLMHMKKSKLFFIVLALVLSVLFIASCTVSEADKPEESEGITESTDKVGGESVETSDGTSDGTEEKESEEQSESETVGNAESSESTTAETLEKETEETESGNGDEDWGLGFQPF